VKTNLPSVSKEESEMLCGHFDEAKYTPRRSTPRPALADGSAALRLVRHPHDPAAKGNKTVPFPVAKSASAIWQDLPDAVVIIDRRGRIALTNAAARRVAQVAPQGMPIDLAPQIWGRMLDLEGQEVSAYNWPCAKAMRGESTTQQEYRLVHANGSFYDVLFSAAPMGGTNGEAGGVLATFTDITQHNRRALLRRQQAVTRERGRMAEDIHDSLCQKLNAIVLQLQTALDCLDTDCQPAIRHFKTAYDVARESLAHARRSMWTFCHESLGDIDPAFALSDVAKQAVRGTPISLDLSLQERPRELPPQVSLELLRISQEALSNVVKHSQATKVQIMLIYRRRALHFSVQDDGRGFIRASDHLSKGFGLLSMRERAERLGGTLSVVSRPGKGTRVVAIIPLSVLRRPGPILFDPIADRSTATQPFETMTLSQPIGRKA
jgi:signal transduction histidine kinase